MTIFFKTTKRLFKNDAQISYVLKSGIPIVRYDCSHGFFHRDVLYPGSEKEKQTINITNLEDALNYAEQDIKDRWEFYKERYLKKLKS